MASTEMTEKSDGMTSVLTGTDLIVMGGWSMEKLWCLDLPATQWREWATQGSAPSPRLFHSSCADPHQPGVVYVTGGELLASSQRQGVTGDSAPYYLDVYRLTKKGTGSGSWERLECSPHPSSVVAQQHQYQCNDKTPHDTMPLHRSHHTSVMLGDRWLVVFGGKPSSFLLQTQTGVLTNSAMNQLFHRGFYDVWMLNLQTLEWSVAKQVQRSPISPALWGHSAVSYGSNCMLVYGGFDVSLQPGAKETDVPVAALNGDVYVFNLDNLQWGKCTTFDSEETKTQKMLGVAMPPFPFPRVGHTALVQHGEMVIIGGFTIGNTGAPSLCNDSWIWDAATTRWRELKPFCLPSWRAQRLIAGMYYEQLVATNNLSDLHIYNMRAGGPWETMQCTMIAGLTPAHTSIVASNSKDAPASNSGSRAHSPPGLAPMSERSGSQGPAISPYFQQPSQQSTQRTPIEPLQPDTTFLHSQEPRPQFFPKSSSDVMARTVEQHRREKAGLNVPEEEASETEVLRMEIHHLRSLVAQSQLAEVSNNKKHPHGADQAQAEPATIHRDEDGNKWPYDVKDLREQRRQQMGLIFDPKGKAKNGLVGGVPQQLLATASPHTSFHSHSEGGPAWSAYAGSSPHDDQRGLPKPRLRKAVEEAVTGKPLSPLAFNQHALSPSHRGANNKPTSSSGSPLKRRLVGELEASPRNRSASPTQPPSTHVEGAEALGSVASTLKAYRKLKEEHRTLSARRSERLGRLQKRLDDAENTLWEDHKRAKVEGPDIGTSRPKSVKISTGVQRSGGGRKDRLAAASAAASHFDDGLDLLPSFGYDHHRSK